MGLTVLDASLIIAVLDADDLHHEGAEAALAGRIVARDTFAVPVSAYAEVLVGPFRRGAPAAQVVDEFLDALPAGIEIASRSIGRRAAQLRAAHGRRLRLPDALVVATALELSAERVLTADRDWPDLEITVQVVQAPRE